MHVERTLTWTRICKLRNNRYSKFLSCVLFRGVLIFSFPPIVLSFWIHKQKFSGRALVLEDFKKINVPIHHPLNWHDFTLAVIQKGLWIVDVHSGCMFCLPGFMPVPIKHLPAHWGHELEQAWLTRFAQVLLFESGRLPRSDNKSNHQVYVLDAKKRVLFLQ